MAEYDRCTEPGEKGALLRREGLYSSLLSDWRRQHRQGLLKAQQGRSEGGRVRPPRISPRALQPGERENIVATLNSERFCDLAPRRCGPSS